MAFDFSANLDFVSSVDGRRFNPVQEAVIRFNLQQAYNTSPTARGMFDRWGQIIRIRYAPGKFQAVNSTGELQIDPTVLNFLSYIDYVGKAEPYTLLAALMHELGHALNGTRA